MFKLIIPTLSVALLSTSMATAQYFGTKYSTSSSFMQPTQPIRLARATDIVPQSSPADTFDDINTLNTLDVPGSNDLQLPAAKPLDRIVPLDQSQLLSTPGGLDSLAMPDMPERLKLPKPADIDNAAVPDQSRNVQPEISANDFDSLEPIAPLQSIVEPAPITHLQGPIDFTEAIQRQQQDLAQGAQQPFVEQYDPSTRNHGGTHSNAHPASNFGCRNESAGACGTGCGTLPYRTPILPPPNSFYGHFRSDPCYFDLWANYPAEAAATCAHNRAKLAPARPARCLNCD